eukprot:CAMPEP_0175888140 /NCGR_PEP_ID=MMETSP0107_2-20121207/46557_1 /TAXON_ID=195067 ORGANISM="Goniomonas pacifica, Strain CCMP1869" /NCGR_SAMPLE_ID=MMETSP0107_2 /ASSEMBLY_ACC=CAM_ASM_000203 /LENGTH=47 /DNA_ID= /DNA_START= /DNA_END= /DNA_ORIENTATION=
MRVAATRQDLGIDQGAGPSVEVGLEDSIPKFGHPMTMRLSMNVKHMT